ncbi:MAG: LytTR family transcriptional regulator DNA-binding domain-containing protein [Flavobacteriales bacterium]|jgi:DNA-binding LytR/AlgR family response regulator|nr:LytTR family transcriptional regulator DNA-binding domain-containing protein [Flavobacteriales bacterium]
MKKGISVLIVEDEFITLHSIQESLLEMNYQIAGVAKNAEEAITILDTEEVDFAFLDIHIQGEHDGIWLGTLINERYKIPFAFLTAFGDSKTVNSALKTEPYGYLLKPFNTIDIYTSIEVALRKFHKIQQKEDINPTEKINESTNKPFLINDHLFIKEQHLYSKINVSDILYIKSELKHISLTTAKKSYNLRYSLKEFAQILPNQSFFQTHRSYLVNITMVDHIGSNILIVNKTEIPISAQRRNEIYKLFNFV